MRIIFVTEPMPIVRPSVFATRGKPATSPKFNRFNLNSICLISNKIQDAKLSSTMTRLLFANFIRMQNRIGIAITCNNFESNRNPRKNYNFSWSTNFTPANTCSG